MGVVVLGVEAAGTPAPFDPWAGVDAVPLTAPLGVIP